MPKPSDDNAIGYLYLIESKDQKAVKFGFASDVYQRMKSLQSGNPQRLDLLAQVRCTYGAEILLHRMLKPRKLRLEWYRDDGFAEALMDECRDVILDLAVQWLAETQPDGMGSAEAYFAALERFHLDAYSMQQAIEVVTEEFEDEDA